MTYNEILNNVSKGLKLFADNCLCEICFDHNIVIIEQLDRDLCNDTIMTLGELGWEYKERGVVMSGHYFNAWIFVIPSPTYTINHIKTCITG